MEFIRCELHNHTNESDGNLSAEELAAYAAEHNFEVYALTDHNVVSGQSKVAAAIENNHYTTQLIKGVEVTTIYGHILGLGMDDMFDFIELNPYEPDSFFLNMRECGAEVIGIAHPFCISNPIMTGCRYTMELDDYRLIDYIEVYNTSGGDTELGDRFTGNYDALNWWEDLVHQGYDLAALTGKDLHDIRPEYEEVFLTYVPVETKASDKTRQVINGIKRQETFITKGPWLTGELRGMKLRLKFDHRNTYLNWHEVYQDLKPVISVRYSNEEEEIFDITFKSEEVTLPLAKKADRVTLRIYDKEISNQSIILAGKVFKQGGYA